MDSVEKRASFRPALLVVDVQEDFCPPVGIIPNLLSVPDNLHQVEWKSCTTRDFHPQDHISFATSHPAPNNKPFESTVKILNPFDQSQNHTIRLWPPHCVQGTPGVEIIPEIDVSKLDVIVDKGKDSRLEVYSGFADVFGRKSSEAATVDLTSLLQGHRITHVYTVGLAGDFCVKCTAVDAKKEGFEVYVVEEAVKSIDSGPSGWEGAKASMTELGIHIVSTKGEEVALLKQRE
ncbi:uncharacterized protein KY384_001468 [Bacidia gigantensis]|uniref:uncharacterized protein n=1 Tax=Bacidia gigantensis TaxID=2732470 RepID=UPI001D045FA8|nr:uncharacterized protein KY384_001468 [Bacidia gigantensis]KAG8533727.1 hypothetical protein KY384_001468 [Bacidia gigantensis]